MHLGELSSCGRGRLRTTALAPSRERLRTCGNGPIDDSQKWLERLEFETRAGADRLFARVNCMTYSNRQEGRVHCV